RSWELKYDIDRADGQRQIRYKSFKGTRREALAELTRLLAQAQAGGHVEPTKITVADYVRSRIKQWHASGVIAAKCYERYQELVDYQFARFPLGSRPLQKLTAADVEAWHNALKIGGRQDGGGLSARTVGDAHRLLSQALRGAVRFGLLLRNVATEERPPKIVARPMQILSPEQVKDLPAQLAGRPICAPAVIALFTGMRRGELLALRWSDVDLDRKLIKVHAALEQTV